MSDSALEPVLLDAGPTFECYEATLSHGVKAGSVTGPDVAVIGFVPHVTGSGNLGGHQASFTKPQMLALRLLFQSGNYLPYFDIASIDCLVRYLHARREYRGAALIADVALEHDSEETPVRVRFKVLPSKLGVGYTLLQHLHAPLSALPQPRPGSLQWQKSRVLAHKGVCPVGDQRLSLTSLGDGVRIRHWQSFRIAGIGSLFSKIVFKSFAPYAWIELEYNIYVDRPPEVFVVSSAIPSVLALLGWCPRVHRSMLQNSPAQISAFVSAGRNAVAPSAAHFRVC